MIEKDELLNIQYQLWDLSKRVKALGVLMHSRGDEEEEISEGVGAILSGIGEEIETAANGLDKGEV